jgi:class 3 adenylate cyclase
LPPGATLGRRASDVSEIVIGPETARQLAGAFELAPLGAISVKGRSQPVEAFAIRIGRRALPR